MKHDNCPQKIKKKLHIDGSIKSTAQINLKIS